MPVTASSARSRLRGRVGLTTRLLVGALAGALAGAQAQTAPFTPARDTEVVERLPLAADPAARQVAQLRRQLQARPDDAGLRIEVAQRYFELAMAQGDARLIGHASAAVAPLAPQAARLPAAQAARLALAQAQLAQYSHRFDEALALLAQAAALAPGWAEPWAWRAAILMVQARYRDARAACGQITAAADALLAAGCTAYARAAAGELAPAYRGLMAAMDAAAAAALAGRAAAPAALTLWLHTRLAEMAQRLGQPGRAEQHFKDALALGLTDQFLLAAYADLLLAQGRPREVLTLLAGWERSDGLLLRLALAAQDAGDTRLPAWRAELAARFAAAQQRGDSLHEQEAARFALDIERDAPRALALAAHNWRVQKEPRDATVLLRAALAAGQPQAAAPVLQWLKETGHEDPALARLADRFRPGAGS